MVKRLLFFIVSISILLSFAAPASAGLEDESSFQTVDNILYNYEMRLQEIYSESISLEIASISTQKEADELKEATINELNDAGYIAYDLNPNTYQSVERKLNTDLSEMGVDDGDSYIVVISGRSGAGTANNDGDVAQPTYDLEDSFYYTYNGEKLKMRFLTLYATDNSRFRLVSKKNVMKSNDMSVIQKLAIDVFYSGIDGLTKVPIGTFLSWLNLEELLSGMYYVNYNGKSVWTRRYTQIYDSERWFGWSAVSYFISISWTDGMMPDEKGNSIEFCSDNYVWLKYSDHYYDDDWQISQAAAARRFSAFRGESTGNVYYSYGNKHAFTHNEPVWP